MKSDLILTSYSDEMATIGVIHRYLSGPSVRAVRLMLREVPIRILAGESLKTVTGIGRALEDVGCKVKVTESK